MRATWIFRGFFPFETALIIPFSKNVGKFSTKLCLDCSFNYRQSTKLCLGILQTTKIESLAKIVNKF